MLREDRSDVVPQVDVADGAPQHDPEKERRGPEHEPQQGRLQRKRPDRCGVIPPGHHLYFCHRHARPLQTVRQTRGVIELSERAPPGARDLNAGPLWREIVAFVDPDGGGRGRGRYGDGGGEARGAPSDDDAVDALGVIRSGGRGYAPATRINAGERTRGSATVDS